MSRKKNGSSKNNVPNSSWFLIKDQIKRSISSYFNKHEWMAKDNKGYYFQYKKRHPLITAMCGEYDIIQGIPESWSTIWSEIFKSECEPHQAVAEMMLTITKEEFRTGALGNKKFNHLVKKIKCGDAITKPKFMNIVDYISEQEIKGVYNFYGPIRIGNYKEKIKTVLSDDRIKSVGSTKIYISCDPWDIFRMGVGKNGKLGSCMNTLTGQFCNQVPPNFQDPAMAIVFAEEPEDNKKRLITGLKARCIVRLLRNQDDYGLALDRYYGNDAYRISIINAVNRAAKKVGIKTYCFSEYKHSAHCDNHKINEGNDLNAHGPLVKFKMAMPYIDQGASGGFKILKSGVSKHPLAVASFNVIETDSLYSEAYQ